MSIDLGFLFPFRNPDFARRPWAELYRDDIALAVHSETLGFDHVWLTEHHFVDDGYSPALMPIATAMSRRRPHVCASARLSCCCPCTPRCAWPKMSPPPMSFPMDASTSASASAIGSANSMAWVSHRASAAARFNEQLPLMRRLLDGETVSYEGKYHQFSGARIMPPPVQTSLPLWVGARGDRALDRAARMGCHLAGVSAEHRLKYREALSRHGRVPDDYHVSQMVLVYVADNKAQAWQEAARPVHHMLTLYRDWAAEAGDENNDDQASRGIPSPGTNAGGPGRHLLSVNPPSLARRILSTQACATCCNARPVPIWY